MDWITEVAVWPGLVQCVGPRYADEIVGDVDSNSSSSSEENIVMMAVELLSVVTRSFAGRCSVF